jgi:beta-aspartyl-peptidase (threonine type)
MKTLLPLIAILLLFSPARSEEKKDWAIVVHGGAGKIDRESLSDEVLRTKLKILEEAVDAGSRILESGGTSLDAVEAAIVILEDSPYFNAGKGAVFTRAETNELDASIMEGRTLNAGAVGGATRTKNPIRAARAVMEKTEHVLLAGEGADQFARESGLEIVDPEYFRTKRQLDALHKRLEKEKAKAKAGRAESPDANGSSYLGTVGAVALDSEGNIAAGTSTGGLTAKRFGRLGDSPIIGAGTYAKNGVGGISCTGHGEFFIRFAVAHDVVVRSEYREISLEQACEEVINHVLKEAGGSGGLIGIDGEGNVVMKMNSGAMWRSWRDSGGANGTAVFSEEEAGKD